MVTAIIVSSLCQFQSHNGAIAVGLVVLSSRCLVVLLTILPHGEAILQLAAVLESLGAEVMVLKFEGRLVQMGHDEIQAVLRRIR
jgi:hypothetical protein